MDIKMKNNMILFPQMCLYFLRAHSSLASAKQTSKVNIHTTNVDELALIIDEMVSDDNFRDESDAAQESVAIGFLKAHQDVMDSNILDPERELGFVENYDEFTTKMERHHHSTSEDNIHVSSTIPVQMDSEGMTFHFGLREAILFPWWNSSSIFTMIISCIIVALLSILNEQLKFYNNYLQCSAFTKTNDNISIQDKFIVNEEDGKLVLRLQYSDDNIVTKLPLTYGAIHLWRTLLYGTQIVVSCLLMLIFMTYNGWLWLAVLVGAAIGYSVISKF